MSTSRKPFLATHLSVLLSLVLFNASCGRGTEEGPTPTPSNSPPPQDLPAQCKAADVQHHDIPIYWGQANSPRFTYYFQVQMATVGNPSTAPIGILINGGAGAPSIGFPPGTLFPPTFNVIYTDVRGVGCNVNSANHFKADALTTEYFSRDALSIVLALHLTDYVLFGLSYGTVQATVMANIARNEG